MFQTWFFRCGPERRQRKKKGGVNGDCDPLIRNGKVWIYFADKEHMEWRWRNAFVPGPGA